MPNSFYNHSTYPSPNSPGSSAGLRNELDLITAGFNLLPTLTGNGYKVAMVNAAGTALIASSALQALAITASTIDSTPIGATTAAAGSFTTLSASSGITGNLTGNVTGNVTGNITSAGASSFTSATISSTPTNSSDVTSKSYVDTQDALRLALTGGTMAGNIAMNTNKITGMSDPTNNQDAATKYYVDLIAAGGGGGLQFLSLAGGTMTGPIIFADSQPQPGHNFSLLSEGCI